jgi:4-oxalmesaconate hydratase
VIIDVHGHYTTTPDEHQAYRDAQLACLADPSVPAPVPARISDEQIRDSIEGNQLKVLRERGCDLTLDGVIAELRRTVALGFVGCNVNPDASGTWAGAPITHPSWFPLWEAVEQLDIPAMIHVSTACNPNFHTLGAHYLNADTSVFVQLLQSDLFQRFPGLRLVIPHGGGAVPYHWGRYRGLAMRNGWQDPSELLRNLYFDTCVYHQAGIDLLTRVVPAGNVLFASEMLGAVRGADPETGVAWDDTLHYVDHAGLDGAALAAIHAGNARRVYPALERRLVAQGR